MSLTFNANTGEWEGQTGGVDLKELNTRKPKAKYVREKKEKKSQQLILAEIKANPLYNFCFKIANIISEAYGFETEVIFRNIGGARHNRNRKTDQSTIEIGYELLNRMSKTGGAEYYTIGHVWAEHGFETELTRQAWTGRKIWRLPELTGLKAAWQLMLHEMAHALQVRTPGGRPAGEQHNETFIEKLNELIILFPYEEVLVA